MAKSHRADAFTGAPPRAPPLGRQISEAGSTETSTIPGIMRRGTFLIACAVASWSAAGLPDQALAQDAPFPTDEFSGMTFYPAPGVGNYLMVEGATLSERETPPVGVFFDYALNPVEVFSQCEVREEIDCNMVAPDRDDGRVSLASSMFAINLTGAYVFGDRLQIGLVLPLVFSAGDPLVYSVADGGFNNDLPGGDGFGIGDPRLHLKLHIFGSQADKFALAAVLWGTAPLGQLTADNRFIGDGLPMGGGHVLFEMFFWPFRFTVGLGGSVREVSSVVATEVGPMLDYMAAGELRLGEMFGVLLELYGRTLFNDANRIDHLEVRGAGRFSLSGVEATLGAGVGVILGPGVPDFRILAGVSYGATVDEDSDSDGIIDEIDACPAQPEDEDGYQDDDGCPETDNDLDNFPDDEDPCPNDAEDLDDFEDDDGCPEEDNDNDGVRDGYDSCPNTPEDMDGDRDDDGCPDEDTDRDGIPDRMDQCPEEPEDTDGFADLDGCPEDDVDEDGVNDDEDLCPETPEDIDDFEDRDGCPEEGGSIRASPPE